MVNPSTAERLSKNLRYLMDRTGWSETAVAERAKVSQKTVNNALNENYKTKVDTAERIASAFGLEGWHLIMPNLPQDVESGGSISQLVKAYLDADESGKELIKAVAFRESKRIA